MQLILSRILHKKEKYYFDFEQNKIKLYLCFIRLSNLWENVKTTIKFS